MLLYSCIVLGSKQQANALYFRLRDVGTSAYRPSPTQARRLIIVDNILPDRLCQGLIAMLPSLDQFTSEKWTFLDTLSLLQAHSTHSLRRLDVHVDLSDYATGHALHVIRYFHNLEVLNLEAWNAQPNSNDPNQELILAMSDIRPLTLPRLAVFGCGLQAFNDPRAFFSFVAQCRFPALEQFSVHVGVEEAQDDHLSVLRPFFASHTSLSKLSLDTTTAEQSQFLLTLGVHTESLCLNPGSRVTAQIELPRSVRTLHVDTDDVWPWETALPALAVLAWSSEARGGLTRIQFNFSWASRIRCSAACVDPDGTADESEEREAAILGRFIFFSQRFARLGIAMIDQDGLSLEKGKR
jgi:hypothetical protein